MRFCLPVCLLLSVLLADGSRAQNAPLPLRAVAPSEAVSQQFSLLGATRAFGSEIITEVMVDATGFLWIGTREGLVLHDGQSFRRFQHEVNDPDSISSNGIRGVMEDAQGRLWINTISGGLNLLDRSTWRFRSWRHDRNNPDSLSHDGVFALAPAPDGRLWVGTQAGLDLFDPDSGRFEHRIVATGGEFIIDLHIDAQGRLWVATLGQGLFRLREDGDGFIAVPGTHEASPLDVFALAHDREGTLWVGSRHGLFRVEAGSDVISVSPLQAPEGVAAPENVTALQATPDGGLWVGSFGNGLFWRAPGSQQLEVVNLGVEGPAARHIDGGALTLDRDGNLLVGTFGAGLLRASTRIQDPRIWRARDADSAGLAHEDVYALLPESSSGEKRLLVGSFGGGLDEIDLGSAVVQHKDLPVSAAEQERLSGITDLLRTPDGTLWASTNEGVFRWNEARNTFHFYDPQTSQAPGYSFSLLEDARGRLWVGGAGDGLYLYQPDSDGFRNFLPVAGEPQSLSDDFITDMVVDEQERLWLGTRSGGVNLCRFDGNLRCQHLGAGAGKNALGHDHVTALLQGHRAGEMWLGTAGGGLHRVLVDAHDRVLDLQRWTREEGLTDNNVMAMAYAQDGALWLSSHDGLTRLEPDTGRIDNYLASDGLPTAVFNPKAAQSIGDRLYFGSAKGVVSLPDRQPQRNSTAPPTVIERILGLEGEQLGVKPAWLRERLEVPWRMPFSLEFAVLGFGAGEARFQYRLASNAPWVDLDERGQLTLHALAPGSYDLEVRGRKGGHGWTLAAPLHLDIVPPWWRRSGVQGGALAALLMLLSAAFLWRVRELQQRNRALQQVHDERELAFAQARESRDRLGHAFDLLRRLTMKLEATKEEERKHLSRELHDEFGQALTGIKINLGVAQMQTPALASLKQIKDATSLVDGLISQVRALSLDLRPPLIDEVGLVPALETYLHTVAQRSDMPIRITLDPEVAMPDPQRRIAVFRIVQEALTNALRHAKASQITVEVRAQDAGVRIEVCDDGCGFEVGERLGAADQGLGLFGVRERVHDLGGEWQIDSHPGQGTRVRAFIPVNGERDARDTG
jgi:signal transduction histidine kinase/streptogramin lyase